ncbi:hypothetical protein [Halalkalicoccus salilacus]|uniref:hypothetical protein n=1 Tax=Halalkalicoccus sp. GCM10025704 TaxID=3252662 RepID=UPI003619FB67
MSGNETSECLEAPLGLPSFGSTPTVESQSIGSRSRPKTDDAARRSTTMASVLGREERGSSVLKTYSAFDTTFGRRP